MRRPGLQLRECLKLSVSWGDPPEHPFVTPFLSTKRPGKSLRFVSRRSHRNDAIV
jgi:hypothetical protein